MGWWRDRTQSLLPPVVLLPLLALLPMLAYPPLEWSALAWVGLAPLMLLIRHAPGGPANWLAAGWGYGALFYALQYAWVGRTLLELGGVPVLRFIPFSVAGLSFLALFPALVIAGSRWGCTRFGISPYWSFPLLLALQDALLGVFPFGGLAWGSLAATQTGAFAAQWLAPLAGGPALVLLLGVVNGGWAWAAQAAILHRRRAWPALAFMGAATILFASSWPSVLERTEAGEKFSALLVPGNFISGAGAQEDSGRLRSFVARTLRHNQPQADSSRASAKDAAPGPVSPRASAAPVSPRAFAAELVIWPEGAASGRVEEGKKLVELSQVATAIGADILLGSDSRREGRDYNSAYLVTGGRFDFQRYDKRRLVPFGEYVPTGFRWFFGQKVTSGEKDYLSGRGAPVLQWRENKLGLAICSESILPGHMRMAARQGAQVMVVIANDQWLTPAARLQHLRLSTLRSLETDLDLLFVSNGGWNAHVSRGRIREAGNHEQEMLVARPHLRRVRTPWVRWGYGPFALLLAGYVGAGLFLRFFSIRASVRKNQHR